MLGSGNLNFKIKNDENKETFTITDYSDSI